VTAEIHHYSADQTPNPWRRILTGLVSYPVLIWRHRELVANFTQREFWVRFQGSMLGPLWVLIHPLFLFTVYFLVFGVLLDMRQIEGQPAYIYPLYLLSGILAWTVFNETAVRSCTGVLENGNLIKKVAFPSELLPLHLVVVNLLVFVVGALALLVVSWFLGANLLGWNLWFLPLVLLIQLVFTMGVSLFLATANVFLRDTSQIFTIGSQAWFFATPIFWYEKMFGDSEGMAMALVWLRLNPMYYIVNAHRMVLGLPTSANVAPSAAIILEYCGYAFLPAFVCFMLGYAYFKAYQHRFADEV
jgi:lipopolysaccharide transport system permease protein